MLKFLDRIALLRFTLLAVMFLSCSNFTAAARDARIEMSIVKAGLVVGVGGGSGMLHYKGKAYAISVGGLSLGATIGASVAKLSGTVRGLDRVSDIVGQYSAVGGGGAVVIGATAVKLQNQKGVIINLSGSQAGLELTLDVGGMAISLE